MANDSEVVEKLVVSLETNANELINNTDKAVKVIEGRLKGMGDTGEEAFDKTGAAAQKAAGFYRDAAGRIRDANGRFVKMGSEGAEAFRKTEEAAKGAAGHYRDAAGRLRDASGRFVKMGEDGKQAFDKTGKSSKRLGLEIGVVSGFVSALTQSLIQMAARGVQLITDVTKKAIGMQSAAETAQTVFENMFGDPRTATAVLENIRKRAAELKVPFSEASQFAKSILPDTGSVDEFNEILRLASIGAKDANLSLSELIFSFNEALSGDFVSIKDRLDIPKEVIERIKSADDRTGALVEELNKLFTKRGINDAAAFDDTLAGIVTNVKVFADDLLFIAGQPGFESLKDAAQRLQEILNQNRPQLEAIATALGELAGEAVEFVSTKILDALENLDTEQALELVDSMKTSLDTVRLFVDAVSTISFDDALDGAQGLVDLLNRALFTAAQLGTLVKAETARQVAEAEARRKILAQREQELGVVGATIRGFGGFSEAEQAKIDAAAQEAYNQTILDALPAFDEYNKKQEERKNKTEQATKVTGADADALDRVNEHLAEGTETLSKLTEEEQELLTELGADLLDTQDKINQDLEELQEDHDKEMLEIEKEFADKRREEAEELSEDLADLEAEVAEKRSKIISDAKDELKQLEEETDREIEQRQDDFNRDELRRTEDHQRRLRDLRLGFIDDLEQGVKNRDAAAIVDARKRFDAETQQAEEEFSIESSRRDEDENVELSRIREQENLKAQEITAAREKDLMELMAYEQRKEAELQAAYAKQIEDINAAEQTKLNEQQVKFDEKQTLLEEQMQRELETIAKSLAEQADVSEEGAGVILEKLAEVFGIGGSIDELMEEYRKRVADLGDLKVNIEVEESGPSGGSSSKLPTQQASQGFAIKGGAFQHGTHGPRLFSRPTAAIFAEAGPEVVNITPASQLSSMGSEVGGTNEMDINLKISGSAPPGITTGADRDALAAVMVDAFRQAGLRNVRS